MARLSHLYQIHATLYQYIDFLATVLSPQEYSNLVPSLADLWGTYGIESGIAFQMIRPKVLTAMRVSQLSLILSIVTNNCVRTTTLKPNRVCLSLYR